MLQRAQRRSHRQHEDPEQAARAYLLKCRMHAIFVSPNGRIQTSEDPARMGAVPRVTWWGMATEITAVAEMARGLKLPPGQAIMFAARRLEVRLLPHLCAISRAQISLLRLENRVAKAQGKGALSAFNQEYKRQRLAAQAAGVPFMSYPEARARLQRVLAGAAAEGRITAGLLERVFAATEDHP
jgi:hypothetical protein